MTYSIYSLKDGRKYDIEDDVDASLKWLEDYSKKTKLSLIQTVRNCSEKVRPDGKTRKTWKQR